MYQAQPARFRSLTLVATNAFTDTPVPLGLNVARVPVAGEAIFSALCSRAGLAVLWLPGDLAGAGHSRLRAAPRPEPGAVRH